MLSAYVAQKLHEASYKPLEDGTYFGEITSLPGVWGEGKTLEKCRQDLQEALEGWMIVSLHQRRYPSVTFKRNHPPGWNLHRRVGAA